MVEELAAGWLNDIAENALVGSRGGILCSVSDRVVLEKQRTRRDGDVARVRCCGDGYNYFSGEGHRTFEKIGGNGG